MAFLATSTTVRPAGHRPGAGSDERIARLVRLVIFAACGLYGLALLAMPIVSSRTVTFSPLWYNGLIVLVLAAVGAGLDRLGRPRWPVILAYLLVLDIFLALSTKVLFKLGLAAELMPAHEYRMLGRKGYEFHPLMQTRPTPSFQDATRTHTAEATRAVAPHPSHTAAAASLPQIAVVGGSSTYDITVKQGESWPDRLQQKLPGYRIWNFGVQNYTTVQHVMQTAFYLPERNISCAVYYFGWNDIRQNAVPGLDPAYADYHMIDMGNGLRLTNNSWPLATLKLPSLLAQMLDIYPQRPSHWSWVKPSPDADPALERYWRRNIRSVVAVARAQGMKVAIIGQLLNYPMLERQPAGARAFYAIGTEDRHIPRIMEHFNAIAAQEAKALGVPFLMPSQSWMAPADYSDFGHFTPSGAEKFASRVVDFVDRTCKS